MPRVKAKTPPAQLEREIAHALAKKGGKTRGRRAHSSRPGASGPAAERRGISPARRVAYRIKLTPSELRAVEFARGRYSWPDMLSTHAAEDGSIAFTESEMWNWTDDVDADTEGGHSPFPLASDAFANKLQRFYDERI